MFVVDTNILVYAVNGNDPAHEVCKTALAGWRHRAEPWCLTWGICFEFLRVVTHRRAFPSPLRASDAWKLLDVLLESPGLKVLAPSERYPGIVQNILDEIPLLTGNDMHDMAIAALMRDHGIKTIYTRDTGFHRFGFLEVIDPTTQNPYGSGLHEA